MMLTRVYRIFSLFSYKLIDKKENLLILKILFYLVLSSPLVNSLNSYKLVDATNFIHSKVFSSTVYKFYY
jgi:hypothetical protein